MLPLHVARSVLAGVDLVEGLPVHETHTRLEIGLRLGDTGQGILSFYLAEMADRETHQATGHRTAAQYAADRLGMDRRRAGELIAAGRKLRELPRIHEAFCDAEIGWSKVLQLVRVAAGEHEEAWLERAKAVNCEELRRQVKLTRAGAKPRETGDRRGIREPRFRVRVTMGALGHEVVQNAKRKLGDERGEPVGDAEFMEIAAKLILGSDDDGTVPGRKRVDHSLYQIVLHQVRSEASPDASPELQARMRSPATSSSTRTRSGSCPSRTPRRVAATRAPSTGRPRRGCESECSIGTVTGAGCAAARTTWRSTTSASASTVARR